jgi:hypothetical protein
MQSPDQFSNGTDGHIRPAATPDKYKMVQARLENCSERRQKVTIQARTASLSSGWFIIM